MRLWSVPPLLLALLLALAGVAMLHAADDPGTLYLQVHAAYQAGSKFEIDGKLDEALQKFRFCVSLLEQIQKDSPEYVPVVVDYRLRKSRESIARVQSIQAAPPGSEAGAPAVSPARPVAPRRVEPPATRFPRIAPSYRIPIPGEPPPVPTGPVGFQGSDVLDTTDAVMGRGAVNALKDEIRALQSRLMEEKQANEDLNRRLLESTAEKQSALTEVDRTKVRVVELQSQLDQAHQSLNDLQQANDRLSREKDSDRKQIARLESDLESARADLEVADEYNSELFTKLEQAGRFIDTAEKIRVQLLADRQQMNTKLKDRASSAAQSEKQRAEAAAQADALKKQAIESGKITDENKTLSQKLAGAEKQLAELSKNQEERGKIESGLRDEAASVNKSLADMRDQLKAGQQRIAELEKQLSDTASATAGATGAMAEENALLKSLVTRQLQEQAKRQQARKLVEEEMQKLQVRSADLLGKLNTMAGSEAALTPQEKKLFDRPVATAGDHSDFALEVIKKTPESDLPPELVARAAEANELSQQRKFAEAKDIYGEIAQKAPQSYLAAVNLGIAQRQLGDYPQAIAAFKRALELKHDDSFALTNLGTAEYRNGSLAEAVGTLKQAVAADAQSYLAHYLLGMALNDQGDRVEARREVQKSLDLKSDYAPAAEFLGQLREDSSPVSPKNAVEKKAP